MNAFWDYFWPPFGAGLVFGLVVGWIALRVRIVRVRERPHEPDLVPVPKLRQRVALAAGVAASILFALLWHGPLGAANRFSTEVESASRQMLDYYEMTQVKAHLHHGPLTRRLVLSGPADDFQTTELVKIMSRIPGVSTARWTEAHPGPPLIVEGCAVAVLGFLLGLLIAYLRELRRRYNAHWNW
jgi:uncharacterized membrane-anchored protein YhcB (DUF1043 family)